VLFKNILSSLELLKGHGWPTALEDERLSFLKVAAAQHLIQDKKVSSDPFPVICSRFFISSFRSCPTQLWIRGTIVSGGNYGQYYSAQPH
jgi:hypothetical protein